MRLALSFLLALVVGWVLLNWLGGISPHESIGWSL